MRYKELKNDILKLKVQYDETYLQFNIKTGIGLMIIDVAPKLEERIKESVLKTLLNYQKCIL